MAGRNTSGRTELDCGGSRASVPLPRIVVSAIVFVAVAVVVATALGSGPFAAVTPGAVLDSSESDGPSPTVEASEQGTVTIEYRTESGSSDRLVVDDVDPRLIDARAGWVVVDRSLLPPALETAAGDPESGIVTVGDKALVGNLSVSSRDAGNATVTVVVPAGMDADSQLKSYFLAEFVSPYDLGPHGTDATIVLAPDALPHRGATYADGTAYVTVPQFWDGHVGSVWLHEYVHLRQGYDAETEMVWFTEASAEYLSYRIMAEQYEEVTDDDVRSRLESLPEHPDATLSEPLTWNGESVDYTRGPRLLYAVDAAVRDGSDGEYTLFDVFRAMNELDDPVTVEEFRSLVEEHSGEEEPWIEDAITDAGPMDQYREYDELFSES
ncbi:putative metalloprotease, contains C-terminal PDZ domain [Halalkaliarchaeum sp. AArc-CO]|uniref:hypothetical protein n=1 Tax=Halalkaliarchaeum sp. AArc-CO TaxID=2866381 RepID=UPI00217EA101|nr:hypothetical protein [Halalkaliarchaeum sp. AArc-CO]UWG50912.1 putative metalloprotease, contains C-terminal PDZ domain [Halalkaliarchaeum sp. AArc-CO]